MKSFLLQILPYLVLVLFSVGLGVLLEFRVEADVQLSCYQTCDPIVSDTDRLACVRSCNHCDKER